MSAAILGFVIGFCCGVPITVLAIVLIEERESKQSKPDFYAE